MSRNATLSLFFVAVLLQAGAYGLTFLMPRLFATFGANEKIVGAMLAVTAMFTIPAAYYAGHLADRLGRLRTLALACVSIAASLALYGASQKTGFGLVFASALLGAGWGLTYSLCPVALARLTPPVARVRAFALLSTFVMAGFGSAPVVASGLEALGATVRAAFFLTAMLSLVSALIFAALSGPMARHALSQSSEAPSRMTLSAIIGIVRSPAIRPVLMAAIGASVFAGLNTFQTVFADARGLPYAVFFATYTVTVVVLRIVLVRVSGGARPYLTIGALQTIMCASVLLFMVSGDSLTLYVAVAILFGLGYGASYPILVAMAANDAEAELGPQTLQLFALSYFVGIFGFPLIAGWIIVELGMTSLLAFVAGIAAIDASIAFHRVWRDQR